MGSGDGKGGREIGRGAAKCNGVSLNSKLLIGPDLLNNLVGVLLRFREEKVVIGADIDFSPVTCY